MPVLGIMVKQRKSVIWIHLKRNLSTAISMKSSSREHFIDMVIYKGIFKN